MTEKTFGLTGDLGVGMFKMKLIATIIGFLLVLPLVDCRGEPAVQKIVPFDTVLWDEPLDDSTSTVDTVIWSCCQGVQEDIRDVG